MNFRPGFLVRLSHLILIQVIFVFAALALIMFFSGGDGPTDGGLKITNQKIQPLAARLSRIISEERLDLEKSSVDPTLQGRLNSVFVEDDEILKAKVFLETTDHRLLHVISYDSPDLKVASDLTEEVLSVLADQKVVEYALHQDRGGLSKVFYSSQYVIHYCPFDVDDQLTGLLVTLSGHDYLISSRTDLQYALLLLFLVAALISLLTVYLISNRFKDPLEKLIHGFEKTAQGELYHMMEPDGDQELRQLATAFNTMSQSLWDNHQRLKGFNIRLQRSNKLLFESQAFLAATIDNSPDCIVATTPDGSVVLFNGKASYDFGYDDDAIVGMGIDTLFTQSLTQSMAALALEKGIAAGEMLGKRRDGTIFPVYLTAAPIMDTESRVIALLYIIKDISESKNFQDMMIRIDRYYTRGEMAGDIAHEINNYLAVLSGNLELIPMFLKKGNTEKIDSKLELMKSTVDRIVRFADGLMDPNQGEAHFEDADINQAIENIVAFLKPQNRFDNVHIGTCLAHEIPLVEFDIAQIQQLMVNLIYNAADALEVVEEDKRISISTSTCTIRDEKAVRISVEDNGPGVPEEKRELLFEKRFTTKRKGHGIGLITCRHIVEAHNGNIGYEHTGGASFYFELPVRRPKVASGSQVAFLEPAASPVTD